ncbi:MAG: O-antigen ligase family protein [Planctomycetales bacterium]|nr:O-antigen ligase family protein [bacterium]UNM08029.1 MAG: O-antigen ligase family protein [Planctomycetales bacterium]
MDSAVTTEQGLGRISFSLDFLMRQLGVIFSFEMTLVMFLFAGIYKEDARFAWIPGDITVLTFGLSFVTGMYLLVRRGLVFRREAVVITGMAILFVIWALLSYLWSPSINYSLRKVALLASLTLWPLASFALIVSHERVRVRRFFVVLMLFSLWIAIESALALLLAARSGIRGFVVTSLSTNYLGLGRVIGPGMLVLVAYYVYFLRGTWQKLLGAGAILMYAVLMLGIGSRGPFLAMTVACGWIVLANLRPARNIRQITLRLLLAITALCMVLGVVFYFVTSGAELPRTLQRLQEAQEEGFEGSTRFGGYAATWAMVDESPIWGRGIGSWPVLNGRGDIRAYPHNIFLEVFFELGIIGLLMFVGMLFYAWRLLPPKRVLQREPWMMLAAAQLLSAFINANISGDLNDNKLFWAFLGMMAVCALRRGEPVKLEQRQDSATALPAQPSMS